MTKMGNFSLNPDVFFYATLSVLFIQQQCCNRLMMLNNMPQVSSICENPQKSLRCTQKILMHVHSTCLHVRQIQFLLQKFQMDCFLFIIMLIYNLYLVIVLPTCNALCRDLPTDFLVPH